MHISTIEKLLLGVLAVLAVVIVMFTAVALFARGAVPGAGLRKIDPSPRAATESGMAAFTLIGQLRVSTKPAEDDSRTIVIVTPWLEYTGGDTDFYEELDRKQRAIRSTITTYFTRFTESELLLRGERAVKEDLLSLINQQLVLGKLTAIYFNEYQFLA